MSAWFIIWLRVWCNRILAWTFNCILCEFSRQNLLRHYRRTSQLALSYLSIFFHLNFKPTISYIFTTRSKTSSQEFLILTRSVLYLSSYVHVDKIEFKWVCRDESGFLIWKRRIHKKFKWACFKFVQYSSVHLERQIHKKFNECVLTLSNIQHIWIDKYSLSGLILVNSKFCYFLLLIFLGKSNKSFLWG